MLRICTDPEDKVDGVQDMKTLPVYMMESLRRLRGHDRLDGSHDRTILRNLTPYKAVRECCADRFENPEVADEVVRLLQNCGVTIEGFWPK